MPGQRQLSDKQIRALIERGAVIGAACDAWMLYPGWERGVTDPHEAGVSLRSVADHIDYVCQIAGNADHAGIGSDLDGGFGTEQGPTDLDTIADLQRLPEMLRARGYTGADVEKIQDVKPRHLDFESPDAKGLDMPRAAVGAFLGIPGRIHEPQADPAAYDLVVFGAPTWATSLASPARAYLKQMRKRLPKTAFYVLGGGLKPERALKQMVRISRATPLATIIIKDEELEGEAYKPRLDAFLDELA